MNPGWYTAIRQHSGKTGRDLERHIQEVENLCLSLRPEAQEPVGNMLSGSLPAAAISKAEDAAMIPNP